MNLNNKLTTVETKLANVENELKLIKENLDYNIQYKLI